MIHCHDWQTGLAPVLLYEQYREALPPLISVAIAAGQAAPDVCRRCGHRAFR